MQVFFEITTSVPQQLGVSATSTPSAWDLAAASSCPPKTQKWVFAPAFCPLKCTTLPLAPLQCTQALQLFHTLSTPPQLAPACLTTSFPQCRRAHPTHACLHPSPWLYLHPFLCPPTQTSIGLMPRARQSGRGTCQTGWQRLTSFPAKSVWCSTQAYQTPR